MGGNNDAQKIEGGLWTVEGFVKGSSSEGPLVSVVTACRNGENNIESTIESVLSQSYPNVEYIVVDACSSDKTIDVIRKYDDQVSYWTSEPVKGLFDAVNKGVSLATGDLVGVIGSDAAYFPYSVEEAVEASIAQPGAQVFYGPMHVVDERGRLTDVKRGRIAGYGCEFEVHLPTCFVRRSILEDERFREDLRMMADYELMLRLHLGGVWFHHIERPLVQYIPVRQGAPGYREMAETYTIKWEHKQLSTMQYVGRRLALLYRAPMRRLREAVGRTFFPEIEELRAESAVYQANNLLLRHDIEKASAEIASLTAEVSLKAEVIGQLESDLITRNLELTQLEAELAGKDAEVLRLVSEVDSGNTEIEQLKGRLAETERKALAPPTAEPERTAPHLESKRSPGALSRASRFLKRRKIRNGGQ